MFKKIFTLTLLSFMLVAAFAQNNVEIGKRKPNTLAALVVNYTS